MPSKKGSTKRGNKKGGASDVTNFTSSRNPDIKNSAPFINTNKPTNSFFTPKSNPTASRLLSVPAASLGSASLASASLASPATKSGSSFLRYFIVFLIICFLGVNLFLYLVKPVGTSITHLYDPIFNLFKGDSPHEQEPEQKQKKQQDKSAATTSLEKALDEKKAVNNIDNKSSNSKASVDKKKTVAIPEADDSTSKLHMKPKSKAGFCYIGEDRGFRSCIEVGEGDVCMSGDIFPSNAICINPNLRE